MGLRALFSQQPVLDTDPDRVNLMVTVAGASRLYRNAAGRDIYESGYFYAEKDADTGLWNFGESRCVTDESRINNVLAENLTRDRALRLMETGESAIREKYGEVSERNVSCDWKLVQDALSRTPAIVQPGAQPG